MATTDYPDGYHVERIFLRCSDDNGSVWLDETESLFAFEVRGFRFFYHDGGTVTDALGGMRVYQGPPTETVIETLVKAQERIERKFDLYLAGAKARKRITRRTRRG
jgi:hypothetical protein